MIAENLFGNLLAVSNADSTIVLNVPLVENHDAAVIQLVACHSRLDRESRDVMEDNHDGEAIIVFEGLLYIDEDGDGLDADQERQLGTSDYKADTDGDGVSDYAEWRNGRDPTRPENGDDDDDDVHDKKGIIYVAQAIGSDSYTGYSAEVVSNKGGKKKGPKKTVRGGLSIAEDKDTIVIRSGNYGENLDISGKNLKVVIEGKVKL
jgi:regulator of RNase E activity RraB